MYYIYINGRIINKQIPKSHNNPTYMEPQEKTNIYIYLYSTYIYIYIIGQDFFQLFSMVNCTGNSRRASRLLPSDERLVDQKPSAEVWSSMTSECTKNGTRKTGF